MVALMTAVTPQSKLQSQRLPANNKTEKKNAAEFMQQLRQASKIFPALVNSRQIIHKALAAQDKKKLKDDTVSQRLSSVGNNNAY
jgi:hypothetical protein